MGYGVAEPASITTHHGLIVIDRGHQHRQQLVHQQHQQLDVVLYLEFGVFLFLINRKCASCQFSCNR